MKAVVVDNEVNAANYLVELLKEYDEVEVEQVFTDPIQAMVYLIKNPCDVAFLDIEMPVINGIYIAEEVLHVFPATKLCFVTAYNEFAVKAFDLNAIDYVLKPYTKERLDQALAKIQNASKTDYDSLNEIGELADLQLEMICGYDDEDIILLSYCDIYYIEAEGRNLWIQTKDKRYKGNKTLNFYEEKLSKKSFFRTHKSFVVNIEKISKLKPRINYTYDILFRDCDYVVPISRSKIKELKEYLKI